MDQVVKQTKRPRRRRDARQGGATVGRQTSTVTKLSINGGRITCPDTPPVIPQSVWNRMTVCLTGNAQKEITTNQIHDCLRDQIRGKQSVGDLFLVFRIFSVMVWNMTTNSISIAPIELVGPESGANQIGGWMDLGTGTKPPAIAFLWPSSSRQVVHERVKDADPQRKVLFVGLPGGGTYNAYFHCVWKIKTESTGLFMPNVGWYQATDRLLTRATGRINAVVKDQTAVVQNFQNTSMKQGADTIETVRNECTNVVGGLLRELILHQPDVKKTILGSKYILVEDISKGLEDEIDALALDGDEVLESTDCGSPSEYGI